MPSSLESCQGRSRPAAGPTCSAAYPHTGESPLESVPFVLPKHQPRLWHSEHQMPRKRPSEGNTSSAPCSHPSPAQLSQSHPLLGGAKTQRPERTVLFPRPDFPSAHAAGSRPAHGTEQERKCPVWKATPSHAQPPSAWEWLLSHHPSQGGSKPQGKHSHHHPHTDLPTASNQAINKEK